MSLPPVGSSVQVEALPSNVIATKVHTEPIADGNVTIMSQEYLDRTLVLVTEVDKIGYLVQAQVEPGEHTVEFLQNKRPDSILIPTVTLVPLFGTPPTQYTDLYALYATQIAAAICADLYSTDNLLGNMKPVIVGLALRQSPSSQDSPESDLNFAQERTKLDRVLSALSHTRVW
ncbi:hypothetical protein MYAM1_001551 [Malassezia yamatoensis]|uniref:Proteasome assembly chaperone 3 n=1 Tax=Malassezia yamatoensis TaxID=253288 RepID=A0AAJ6CHJ3_9BASI|nr:hypothetical protein MYAM1_001551 [Malassezia yamatoensis]